MSTLLKWAQNTTQGKLVKNNNINQQNGERKWVHPPNALQNGHVAYLVKFLGNTPVDQPKGIDMVKEGIRKLQFTQQIKKSETGQAKPKKVELTISADGVAIQDPKSHMIMHQFPLHRISYCADDKGEKRFFSFIAKQNTENDADEKHECFVFVSDKLAEEITLTIGQAFELAYKRFLETSGRDLEAQRRAIVTQQKIKRLETENNIYKQRLLDLSKFASITSELDQYLRRHQLKSLLELPLNLQQNGKETNGTNGNANGNETNGKLNGSASSNSIKLLDFSDTNGSVPPVPPRSFDNTPSVGTKLENLLMGDLETDNDFDPRSFENNTSPVVTNGIHPPLLAPPPKTAKRTINNNDSTRSFGQDLFGVSPFNTTPTSPNSAKVIDPFEMGDFNNAASQQELENAIGLLDKRILEMKNGFSRGISIGNEDFSIESLDPFRN